MIKIPIVSLKGGVGKSTVAINLAFKLSKHFKVLLVDIDPQNSVATLLCTDFREGFSDVLVGEKDIFSVIKRPIKENPNFHIIPAGEFALEHPLEYEHVLTEHSLKVNLDKLKDQFDIVIFDTPPRISKHLASVLDISNFFITVITPDPASYASFRIFIEFLKSHDFLARFYLIINAVDASGISEDFHVILRSIVKDKLLGILPKDKTVLEAQGNCKPVTFYKPNAPFSIYVDKISRRLLKIIAKEL